MSKIKSRLSVQKLATIGSISVILIVAIITSLTIVNPGYTGVKITLGKVAETPLEPGPYIKAPFLQKIVQVNNKVQIVEADAASVSKDLQSISSVVAVNYRILPNKSGYLYQNVGSSVEDVLIRPAIQECVKAVTAKFTAEELIVNRQSVGEQIKDLIEIKVEPFGIYIELFNIVNFGFSTEFDKAIEAKQTAQQEVLKAEQELLKIKIDTQQVLEKAKVEADSIRARADAEAYEIQKIQEQLKESPLYIEYLKITKWDGKLPQVSGSSSPIIDIRPQE